AVFAEHVPVTCCSVAKPLEEALAEARDRAWAQAHPILITGSFFLVGQAITLLVGGGLEPASRQRYAALLRAGKRRSAPGSRRSRRGWWGNRSADGAGRPRSGRFSASHPSRRSSGPPGVCPRCIPRAQTASCRPAPSSAPAPGPDTRCRSPDSSGGRKG